MKLERRRNQSGGTLIAAWWELIQLQQPLQQQQCRTPNRLCLFLMIEADQWAIPEPSTPAKTLESPLRHQLDLRLVAQMHVTFLKKNCYCSRRQIYHLPMKYRLPSMVLEFVQVSTTTMETEMTAVQCTELKKLSCVCRMTSFNRTNCRTVEFRPLTESVAAGQGSHDDWWGIEWPTWTIRNRPLNWRCWSQLPQPAVSRARRENDTTVTATSALLHVNCATKATEVIERFYRQRCDGDEVAMWLTTIDKLTTYGRHIWIWDLILWVNKVSIIVKTYLYHVDASLYLHIALWRVVRLNFTWIETKLLIV